MFRLGGIRDFIFPLQVDLITIFLIIPGMESIGFGETPERGSIFTPIILQRETEMDYEFLSGGERTAVALAYRLALNQIINSIMSKIKTRGIIILDEPTDGFSEEQISKIRDILEELNAKQLIIVSHEQKIESFVDNVFKTTKEGDVSIVKTNNL